MVRSDWLRTLIVTLASTGLVWGQQAPPPPGAASAAAEKTITVQETGRAPQQCKVLRAWHTAGGAMAYQVKALDTGEVLTIEETGTAAPVAGAPAGTPTRALATRIFHWGPHNTPPAGTPMPPPEVVQVAAPAPAPEPTRIRPVSQSELPVVMSQPEPPPPSLPVVMSGTEEAGSRPSLGSRVKDVASRVLHHDRSQEVVVGGPMPMPTPAGAPAPAAPPVAATTSATWPPPLDAKATAMTQAPSPAPIRPVAAVTPVPAGTTALPPGPPCPCGQCQTCTPGTVVQGPVIIEGSAPKTAGGLLPRLSAMMKRQQTVPGTIISETEVQPVVVTSPPPLAKPAGDGSKPAYLADSQLPPKPAVAVKAPVEPAKPGDWRQSWGKLDKGDAGKVQVAQATPTKTTDAPVPSLPRPFMATPTSPVMAPPPPKAEVRRADPLKDPESYTRLPADSKPVKEAVAQREGPPASPEVPALPTPNTALTDGHGGMPLGAKSVMDAGSPQYVPVPIVTLPDYRRQPQPPAPQLPKPPEPNAADVANAFTNPAATPPAAMPPQAGNAFSPPAAEQPQMPAGAYGNVPPGMMAGAPGMMPPGYAPYGRPGMYPPPAMMNRAMVQPMPGPAMNPAVYYQPNPMAGQPVRPAGYLPPAAAPANRQQPLPSLSSTMNTPEALATLRDSLYPSQREWAADRLGGLDWRSNGEAVQALVVAAQKDPAPSVRAACVRTLAQMRVNTVPVVSALQALKTDGDPRVLHEVEEALTVLAPESTPAAGQAIQRAGAFAPMPR